MDFLFTGIIPNYREIINWSGIIIWSGKITLFENWNIYIYIYILDCQMWEYLELSETIKLKLRKLKDWCN